MCCGVGRLPGFVPVLNCNLQIGEWTENGMNYNIIVYCTADLSISSVWCHDENLNEKEVWTGFFTIIENYIMMYEEFILIYI